MHQLTPLQFIDAVARAGSIRKAAEGLALTSTAFLAVGLVAWIWLHHRWADIG